MGRREFHSFSAHRIGIVSAGVLTAALTVTAAVGGPPQRTTPVSSTAANTPESGPRWSELTAAQRNALKPLERDWASIPPDPKQKWLDIAARMPRMPAAERDRVQARMTEWARLSPQQRGQTRMAFQEAKQVAPQNRQAQWEAYQALTPEQKRQLQSRAVPLPAAAASRSAATQRQERSEKPQTKSNIVPNPAFAARPTPVAPTVVQAQPGATTTLMSKRPSPPAHQQTGLPKIAATPEFVDRTTLLPRRGPQAAATRSAASAPASRRP